MSDTKITITIPNEKKEELKAISKKTGVLLGSLTRKAVYEYLDREKEAA